MIVPWLIDREPSPVFNPLNSLQLSTNHRDRADRQGIHAVGAWGHRRVLVLAGGVAVLHEGDRPRERMLHMIRIVDDKVNLVSRIQVVIDQH